MTHTARVVEYRGVDPAGLQASIAALGSELESLLSTHPEALDSLREVLLLVDPEAGRALAITLFDEEAGLHRASTLLDRRSASQAGGVRTDVTTYEVALRRQIGG